MPARSASTDPESIRGRCCSLTARSRPRRTSQSPTHPHHARQMLTLKRSLRRLATDDHRAPARIPALRWIAALPHQKGQDNADPQTEAAHLSRPKTVDRFSSEPRRSLRGQPRVIRHRRADLSERKTSWHREQHRLVRVPDRRRVARRPRDPRNHAAVKTTRTLTRLTATPIKTFRLGFATRGPTRNGSGPDQERVAPCSSPRAGRGQVIRPRLACPAPATSCPSRLTFASAGATANSRPSLVATARQSRGSHRQGAPRGLGLHPAREPEGRRSDDPAKAAVCSRIPVATRRRYMRV